MTEALASEEVPASYPPTGLFSPLGTCTDLFNFRELNFKTEKESEWIENTAIFVQKVFTVMECALNSASQTVHIWTT